MVVRQRNLEAASVVRRLVAALQPFGCCLTLLLAGCEQQTSESPPSWQGAASVPTRSRTAAEVSTAPHSTGVRSAPHSMPGIAGRTPEAFGAARASTAQFGTDVRQAALVDSLDQERSALTTATAPMPLRSSVMSPQDAASLVRQAEALNMNGLRLVGRGAIYSARAEFLGALRAGAAAVDVGRNTAAQSRISAIDAALLALTEAEDFANSRSVGREADLALAVRSHRSGLLDEKNFVRHTAAQAHQIYCEFACERLSGAVASLPCGSVSLHGLGKVYAALSSHGSSGTVDARAKAEVYLTAALRVDPDNFPAANDLAVLLAEDGRLEQARQVLQRGIATSPHPAMWNNLGAIHDRLGEPQLAAAARWEAQALAAGASGNGRALVPTHNVQWIPAQYFAATARPNVAAPISTGTDAAATGGVRASSTSSQSSAGERRPIQTARQPQTNSLLN